MARDLTPEEADAAQHFAQRLREERNKANLSQSQLAEKMHYKRQTITKAESGDHVPTRDFAIRVDQALGTRSLFVTLLPSPQSERYKLLRRYVHIEQHQATALHQWQALVVPALLQTEAYAREAYAVSLPPRSSEEIDRFVASQMARQDVLWRANPIVAHFVLSEGAVLQEVGGLEVMREQWQQLIEWSANPHVTVQVLPRTVGAHPSMQGSYTILEIEALQWALYVETMAGGDVITSAQTVAHARQRFNALIAHALSPRESIALFHQLKQKVAA